jgi:hypothetical protein
MRLYGVVFILNTENLRALTGPAQQQMERSAKQRHKSKSVMQEKCPEILLPYSVLVNSAC